MTTEPCPGSGQSYLRDKASITVKCEWCDKEMHPKNRIGYLRPHKRPIVADSSDRQLGIYIAKESCPLFSSSRVEPKLYCHQSIRPDTECCHRCQAYRELDRRVSEKAQYAARYFGAECQANPETTFYDYRDDIANRYGFNDWSALPKKLQHEAFREFVAGKRMEKKGEALR